MVLKILNFENNMEAHRNTKIYSREKLSADFR
jgi:hypothetical protein